VGRPPQGANGGVGQRRSWAGMYQRGLTVSDWVSGTLPLPLPSGPRESEAVLRCDSETIAWRDWDVTATSWIAWKWCSPRYRSIR